jgi:hypothetical protein
MRGPDGREPRVRSPTSHPRRISLIRTVRPLRLFGPRSVRSVAVRQRTVAGAVLGPADQLPSGARTVTGGADNRSGRTVRRGLRLIWAISRFPRVSTVEQIYDRTRHHAPAARMDGWWTVAAGIPTSPWLAVRTRIWGGYHGMAHAVIVAPEPILRLRPPPHPVQNRKSPLTPRTVLMDG